MEEIVTLLDITSTIFFGSALIILYLIPTRVLNRMPKLLISLSMGIYVFVGVSNTLEHGGITDYLDRYEDFFEIVFLPLFLFFIYSISTKEELNKRERAEEALKKTYDELELRVEERTAELNTANEQLRREATKRKWREDIQTTLNELLNLSLKDIPLEEILEKAIDQIVSITPLVLQQKGAIFLVEGDPKVLVMKAQRGLHEALLTTCEKVPFGRCICGRAAAAGEIVFADRIDERHENTYEGIVPHGHYCVPILLGKRVLGVINLYVKEGHRRNKTEEEFLYAVANTLAGIIERKHAEDEISKYAWQVEQSNRLKVLFTDILRHDLLNPTGVIRNIAEIMEDDENLKDSKEIAVIKRNVRKLEDIITNASEYAKLEAAEELEKTELDLAELIENVIDDFDQYIKEKKMKVEFKTDREHKINASNAIESVFVNILSNAIKYSPEGTDIKIAIDDADDAKIISFADQGEGIPDEHKEAVFDRFTRKDKSGVKGSGLGLAITKRIVEMHNGKVWVEDNPEGKGTVFIVEIPR